MRECCGYFWLHRKPFFPFKLSVIQNNSVDSSCFCKLIWNTHKLCLILPTWPLQKLESLTEYSYFCGNMVICIRFNKNLSSLTAHNWRHWLCYEGRAWNVIFSNDICLIIEVIQKICQGWELLPIGQIFSSKSKKEHYWTCATSLVLLDNKPGMMLLPRKKTKRHGQSLSGN